MHGTLFTAIGVGIGISWCGMALMAPFVGHFRRVRPRAAVFAGSILMFLGGLGFFGAAVSAYGLDWLPSSFEWPVGRSDRVITMPGGEHVVPVIFSGRVQVYDRNLKFLRGWAVPSYGKPFRVRPAGSDRFDAVYYRTRADTYLLDGTLVRRVVGQRVEDTLPSYGQRLCIPTSPWLLMYTGATTTWLMCALGMATLGFLQWRERRAGEPYKDV